MRILVIALGSLGDLLPFILVADGLRARGHKIVFASHAGYEALLRAHGFDFRVIWDTPSGHGLDDLLQADPGAFWRAVRRDLFEAAAERSFAFIKAALAQEGFALLAPWSAFGAKRAHEELGVPLCSVYLSPHAVSEPLPGPPAGHGLALFPEWFGAPQPGWPRLTWTGFPIADDALLPPLPAQIESFLQQGEPPIVFTPGSFQRQGETFFAQSLAACEKLDRRGIFLTPYAAQIPAALPSTILHFKYVPMQRLLPRSCAMVHHGGIGTCAQAMRAGVPQLVIPRFFDQSDNAARTESMGVGQTLSTENYDGDSAAQALNRLLHAPEVKKNCAGIAVRLGKINVIDEICQAVENILNQ